MKKIVSMLSYAIIMLIIIFSVDSVIINAEECTTAVVSGLASADGKPILWKNRDSDFQSNKVIYVKEQPYSYLALINNEDTSGRQTWIGLNSQGFAIMNSVAYNLPEPKEIKDLEGLIMADALRTCTTVDDFEAFLKKNLGPNLGSQANFGVIDSQGGSALFEVHNKGYKRLNAEDMPEKHIVNTNFARSGKENEGKGYLRFDRTSFLFKQAPEGKISHEYIIQTVSRDSGHALLTSLPPATWKNLPANEPYWIYSNSSPNRNWTSSAVIIHGVKKGDRKGKATMWVMLGEPLTTIAVPLWVDAGEPPAELWEGESAPLCKESLRIKDIIRPLKAEERKDYLDITKLDNKDGTGYLPALLKTEKEILEKTKKFLTKNPDSAKLVRFEKEIASQALSLLQEIK